MAWEWNAFLDEDLSCRLPIPREKKMAVPNRCGEKVLSHGRWNSGLLR
jgi:hypothetical protein